MCEMHAWDTLPYQVNSLKVRVSGAQPCKTSRGSFTDPHVRFPRAEASVFLLPASLQGVGGYAARPVFKLSVARSDPSWLHLLLSVFLPAARFLRGPETLGVNNWEDAPPPHPYEIEYEIEN